MRIDKWLWAVRIFKTRTLAADACRGGLVSVSGHPAKPSRRVQANEVVSARTGQFDRTLKVRGLPASRVGAALVSEFVEDLTPASEYEKRLEPVFQPLFDRPKGSGRPTKRDRRRLGGISSAL